MLPHRRDLHTPAPVDVDEQLVVNRARLEAVCSRCESDFRIKRFTFQCPYCGSRELSIVGGEELLLESIAMEEPAL